MQWIRDYTPELGHKRLYTQALIITLVGNVVLAIGKGVVAYFSGSVAIYADAANSASDVLYSLLMVIGLWVAQQPPDLSHPQGHKRFEPLVGMTVALMMSFAGYEAARVSLERFLAGGLAVEPGMPTLVLVGSAAIKAGMYVSIYRIAQAVKSPALSITAQDNLSDVLTSTAAFVGVIGSAYVSRLLDPLAGFLVAAWIFRAALTAGRENLAYLTGAGASADLLHQIAQVATEVPGVLNVHQVIAEYVGPQLVADVHINLDEDMALNQVHAIADAVEAHIIALPEVDRAYVHVEPSQSAEALPGPLDHQAMPATGAAPDHAASSPQTPTGGNKDEADVAQQIRALAREMGASAHAIWIHMNSYQCNVDMHLEMNNHFSLKQAHQLALQLETKMRAHIPGIAQVNIHLEPMGNPMHNTVQLSGIQAERLRFEVERVLANMASAFTCRDMLVYASAGGPMVSLRCVHPDNLSLQEAHDLSEALEAQLHQQLPSVSRFVIRVEPAEASEG